MSRQFLFTNYRDSYYINSVPKFRMYIPISLRVILILVKTNVYPIWVNSYKF